MADACGWFLGLVFVFWVLMGGGFPLPHSWKAAGPKTKRKNKGLCFLLLLLVGE